MIVWLLLDNFGGHVERSSFEGGEYFSLVAHVAGKSKIAEFNDPVGGHEDILGFHVPVSDAVGVDVVECPDKLLSYFAYFCDLEGVVVLNDVEELSLAQFGHQDELGGGLEGVEQKDDVLVLQLAEDIDLVAHDFYILFFLALLLDALDGHELARELPPGLVDRTVGSLSYQRQYLVVLLLALAHSNSFDYN